MTRWRVGTGIEPLTYKSQFFWRNFEAHFIEADTEEEAKQIAIFQRGDKANAVRWIEPATLN